MYSNVNNACRAIVYYENRKEKYTTDNGLDNIYIYKTNIGKSHSNKACHSDIKILSLKSLMRYIRSKQSK